MQDVDRRDFLVESGFYALAALSLPDPEAIVRRTRASQVDARMRVGRGEVAAVERMTGALGDAAAELGGGHARSLTVRYLTETVGPWLEGSYSERTGRELFAATSSLVHLAGWMAGDAGRPGLAQQYYAHAYRLAAEADAPELAATALRGMAVQEIEDGNRAARSAAVRLAEECVSYSGRIEDSRAVAYYHATLAHAAALDLDKGAALAALTASERAIERASLVPGRSWASHYSPGRWAHESGMILAQLGDSVAAEQHLRLALDIHGLDRRRTRAIVLADLGQVLLRRGDLDGALSTWNQFLDAAEGVSSVKVSDAIADVHARLSRYRSVCHAEELYQRTVSDSS